MTKKFVMRQFQVERCEMFLFSFELFLGYFTIRRAIHFRGTSIDLGYICFLELEMTGTES